MTEKTVNGQKTTYNYNLDGRLKEIKDNSNQVVAQYQYNPFGRRTKKYLPQANEIIYFHYSDEGLIAEFNETGSLIQSYGYKPNSRFTTNPIFTHRSDFNEEKGYAFYINDHLATPQKLILRNGRKVWEASADAFGKTIVSKAEFRNPLRFPGQYKDDESSLRYNWFRYYDVKIGRYITNDPIGLNDGTNTYLYVFGNPLKYFDMHGLKRVPIYEVEKGVEILWYRDYIVGDPHKTVTNNYHEVETVLWNGEVDDKCVLKETKVDFFVGPNQWGLAQLVIYKVTHTEYIYEAPNVECDNVNCNPTNLKVKVTDHGFAYPGIPDLGDYPDNRGRNYPRVIKNKSVD